MIGWQAGSQRSSDGRERLPFQHDGRDRPYLVRLPPRASDGPMPLIVELHGRGIDPLTFDRWTGFAALAAEVGAALAMPAAIGDIWNDGRYAGQAWPGVAEVDDVGYLSALIDDACARLPIDPARVYVVGMSNGATMVGRLICARPGRIAAAAQVAGTLAADLAFDCRTGRSVPLLHIQGTTDRFAPYAGGVARGPWARLILRRRAGPSLGVDAWAELWAERIQARSAPDLQALPPDVAVSRWRGSDAGSEAIFYRIDGGGHTWPGNRTWTPPLFGRTTRTFDATRTIWEFFARHQLG
jgi:polyhydroxybutyrate depolymerase